MTTRQKILANIQTTIEGITRIKSVVVNSGKLPLGLKLSRKKSRLTPIQHGAVDFTSIKTTSPSWVKFCEEMDNSTEGMTTDDMAATLDATINQMGTIKVCTININTLLLHKVDILCWYIQRHKIDVCFLIDVGLTVMESSYRVKEFKQRLGSEVYVGSTLHAEAEASCGVGGQIVIVTENWKQHLVNKTCDESGLGLTLEVYFKTGEGRLLVQGTYWPYNKTKEPGPNSLHTALKVWMKKTGRGGHPLEWIKKNWQQNDQPSS